MFDFLFGLTPGEGGEFPSLKEIAAILASLVEEGFSAIVLLGGGIVAFVNSALYKSEYEKLYNKYYPDGPLDPNAPKPTLSQLQWLEQIYEIEKKYKNPLPVPNLPSTISYLKPGSPPTTSTSKFDPSLATPGKKYYLKGTVTATVTVSPKTGYNLNSSGNLWGEATVAFTKTVMGPWTGPLFYQNTMDGSFYASVYLAQWYPKRNITLWSYGAGIIVVGSKISASATFALDVAYPIDGGASIEIDPTPTPAPTQQIKPSPTLDPPPQSLVPPFPSFPAPDPLPQLPPAPGDPDPNPDPDPDPTPTPEPYPLPSTDPYTPQVPPSVLPDPDPDPDPEEEEKKVPLLPLPEVSPIEEIPITQLPVPCFPVGSCELQIEGDLQELIDKINELIEQLETVDCDLTPVLDKLEDMDTVVDCLAKSCKAIVSNQVDERKISILSTSLVAHNAMMLAKDSSTINQVVDVSLSSEITSMKGYCGESEGLNYSAYRSDVLGAIASKFAAISSDWQTANNIFSTGANIVNHARLTAEVQRQHAMLGYKILKEINNKMRENKVLDDEGAQWAGGAPIDLLGAAQTALEVAVANLSTNQATWDELLTAIEGWQEAIELEIQKMQENWEIKQEEMDATNSYPKFIQPEIEIL